MLTENIINKIFYLISLVLYEIFHDLSFDVLIENFNTLSGLLLDIFAYIYYFLPVIYLFPLLGIIGAIIVTRVVIALIRLVLELIQAFKFW